MVLILTQNQNLEAHPSKKRGGGSLLNVYLWGLFLILSLWIKPDWVVAQTPISGVINSYEQITAIGGPTNITVSSSSPFSVSDLVLIIQMQDATVDITNTSTFGTVQSFNSAGLYEFNKILSISGTTITLNTALSNTYNPVAGLQIIRVPEYPGMGAVITGGIGALNWNGITGGVIALKATTLDFGGGGVITSTGTGFRGGTVSGSFFGFPPSPPYGVTNSSGLGEKGESFSLDPLNNNLTSGSAPSANGGGAGGFVDFGGGGGANAGAGGNAGSFAFGGPSIYDGMSGLSVPYPFPLVSPRVFAGGGGGSGSQNGSNASNGAEGGGIIFLLCDVIDGTSGGIFSNGNTASNALIDDGAGGAGGAGSIIFLPGYGTTTTFTNNFTTLQVHAIGGDGGGQPTISSYCHGTGGGGGGLVWIDRAQIPTNVEVKVCGGDPGVVGGSTNCNGHGPENGAGPGQCGVILDSINNIITQIPPLSFNAWAIQDTLCTGNNLFLDATNLPGVTYFWVGPNGFTSTQRDPTLGNVNQGNAGVYTISAFICNCRVASDTVLIVVDPLPTSPIFSSNQTICHGNQAVLTLTLNSTNFDFTYTDGTTNTTITGITLSPYQIIVTPAATTTYSLINITNRCGSFTLNTFDVVITINSFQPDAGRDTILCLNGTNSFNITLGGAPEVGVTYNWYSIPPGLSGITTPIGATITQPGLYILSGSLMLPSGICIVEDTMIVSNSCPLLDLRVFLQGATHEYNTAPPLNYWPTLPRIGLGAIKKMRPNLATFDLVSITSPYTTFPGNPSPTAQTYTGPTPMSSNISTHPVVDWVLIELRQVVDPANINNPGTALQDSCVANYSAILLEDGQIVDVDGSTFPFAVSFNQSYPVQNTQGPFYIVIKHRNHLPVISSVPVYVNSMGVIQYDFTSNITQAWQDPALPATNYPQLGFYRVLADPPPYNATYAFSVAPNPTSNVACMIGGDGDLDGVVEYDNTITTSDDYKNAFYLSNLPYPLGGCNSLNLVYDNYDVDMDGYAVTLCFSPIPYLIPYYDVESINYFTSDCSSIPYTNYIYFSNVP